jgi:cell division protease FtsH
MLEDFTVAVERIVAGLEKKNRLLNPHERRVVAYHELGHALVALSLPGADPVHKISIIPRGIGALGYTIQRPTEDRFLMTRKELENKMQVLLGGRAAEQIVFGEVSTGASDDLQKVTSIARAIIMRYGMHEKLGNVVYEEERQSFLGQTGPSLHERSFSEDTAREIDRAVRDIVSGVFERTVKLLTGRRDVLEAGATQLLEKETLNEPELQALRDALSANAVTDAVALHTTA